MKLKFKNKNKTIKIETYKFITHSGMIGSNSKYCRITFIPNIYLVYTQCKDTIQVLTDFKNIEKYEAKAKRYSFRFNWLIFEIGLDIFKETKI